MSHKMLEEHCGQPTVGVELPGVYDGVCYWLCAVCKGWQHRFPNGDGRRAKTEVVGRLDLRREIIKVEP